LTPCADTQFPGKPRQCGRTTHAEFEIFDWDRRLSRKRYQMVTMEH